MSRSWRSRHWQQDDCIPHAPPSSSASRYSSSRHNSENIYGVQHNNGQHNFPNGDSWDRDSSSHRVADRQFSCTSDQHSLDESHGDLRRFPAHHPQPLSSSTRETSWNRRDESHDKWRRGQPLPVPSPALCSAGAPRTARGSDFDSYMMNDGRATGQNNQQNRHQTSSKQRSSNTPSSTGRKRPTFPANPPNPWGKVTVQPPLKSGAYGSRQTREHENSHDSSNENGSLTKKQVNVWKKPDSDSPDGGGERAGSECNTLANKQFNIGEKPGNIAKKRGGKEGIQNSNPSKQTNNWPTPIAGASTTPAPINKQSSINESQRNMQNPWKKEEPVAIQLKTPNESFFPTLSNTTKNKNNVPVNSSRTPTRLESTAPLSLPNTSLWGKRSSQSEKSGDVQSKIESSSNVEDFPSLSTALTATRSLQQSQLPVSSSLLEASFNNDQRVKGKGQKKSTNLASFLPPQLSGSNASSKMKKTPPSRAKHSSSTTKTVTVVKKNTSGIKRSVISSATPAATRSQSLSFHRSMIKDTGEPALKKGRQRLTPKKKKLTTLKKRVLEERLRVWKERNENLTTNNAEEGRAVVAQEMTDQTRVTAPSIGGNVDVVTSLETVLIENFVSPEDDDLTDDDEYDEIISNVLSLTGRVGKVVSVFVPRPRVLLGDSLLEDELSKTIATLEPSYVGFSFVRFASSTDAIAGRDILDGIVVGGHRIRVSILELDKVDNRNGNPPDSQTALADRKWKIAVMQCMGRRPHLFKDDSQPHCDNRKADMSVYPSSTNTVVFQNILTEDDYDDLDALNECVEDISSLSKQYGELISARASTAGIDKGNVYVSYANDKVAEKAAQQMNGLVVGGMQISVSTQIKSPNFAEQSGAVEVILENILNDNDFDDEECLNESLGDISNLVRKYGVIGRVFADTIGNEKGRVHVEFLEGETAAQNAAQQLDGMLIGGIAVSAKVASCVGRVESSSTDKANLEDQAPPPIYSGDKIIPERFAACKRVPKIPNSGPRSYAVKVNDERALPLMIEMLGELMRLQERSKDDKNARARRRLVMGLREVARGIRAHKVKMVVMANNLDEYGAIDAKLQEILDMARTEEVPVLFEFNKRKLGKALGKSIKVSVVGIQNADGAQEQFKQLKRILGLV
ncbi:hypothetical protein ACHAW6_011128 [Cyclotella cf. meneghiniana]